MVRDVLFSKHATHSLLTRTKEGDTSPQLVIRQQAYLEHRISGLNNVHPARDDPITGTNHSTRHPTIHAFPHQPTQHQQTSLTLSNLPRYDTTLSPTPIARNNRSVHHRLRKSNAIEVARPLLDTILTNMSLSNLSPAPPLPPLASPPPSNKLVPIQLRHK